MEGHAVPLLALLRKSSSWGGLLCLGDIEAGQAPCLSADSQKGAEKPGQPSPRRCQPCSPLPSPPLPKPKPLSEPDKGSPVPGKDAHRPREGIPEDSMHDSSSSLLGSLEVFFHNEFIQKRRKAATWMCTTSCPFSPTTPVLARGGGGGPSGCRCGMGGQVPAPGHPGWDRVGLRHCLGPVLAGSRGGWALIGAL